MSHEIPVGFEGEAQQERMSNEELGNYLAAVGNGEHKALLLTVMSLHPNTVFAGYDMRQAIARAQGLPPTVKPKTGWIETDTSLIGHCESSFSQIGLVSQELKDPSSRIYGYVVTKRGRTEGISLAGLLLDFSERHNIALRDIFSETSSHGEERAIGGELQFKNRAPLNRVKILRTLIALRQPIRISDVSYQMIGINRKDVGAHCNDLSEKGIINLEHVQKEGPKVEYRLTTNQGEITFHPKYKRLTKEIVEMMQNNPENTWTASGIANQLIKDQPEKAGQTALLESIRKVLGTLLREGVVDAPNFSRENQSRIFLSDEQESLIEELLHIVNDFQNRDAETLARGRKLAFAFATDPKKAITVMQRAKEASSHAESFSSKDVEGAIAAIVAEEQNATVDSIRENLMVRGYRLKPSTIRNHLTRMRDEGSLVSEGKPGSVMHWRLVS